MIRRSWCSVSLLGFAAILGCGQSNENQKTTTTSPDVNQQQTVEPTFAGKQRPFNVVRYGESLNEAFNRIVAANGSKLPEYSVPDLVGMAFGISEKKETGEVFLSWHKAQAWDVAPNMIAELNIQGFGKLKVVAIESVADHETGWDLTGTMFENGIVADNATNHRRVALVHPSYFRGSAAGDLKTHTIVDVGSRRVAVFPDVGGKLSSTHGNFYINSNDAAIPTSRLAGGKIPFDARGGEPEPFFKTSKGKLAMECSVRSSISEEESLQSVFGSIPMDIGNSRAYMFDSSGINWRLGNSIRSPNQPASKPIVESQFSLHIDFDKKDWARSSDSNVGFPADLDGNGQVWEDISSGSDSFVCFSYMETWRVYGRIFDCLHGIDLKTLEYKRLDTGEIYLSDQKISSIRPQRVADGVVATPFQVSKSVGSCRVTTPN